MKSKNKKLTSVKIHPDLFNRFKEYSINEDITFQKVAERSLFLYLNDDNFKKLIDSFNDKHIK